MPLVWVLKEEKEEVIHHLPAAIPLSAILYV
jgi:hypothetical protein